MHLDMARFAVAPPAPPSATAAAQASVIVESTPPGADIEVDGAFVGNTPSTVSVALGNHQITVKKKGFTDWTKTLNVTGGNVHLNAELDATALVAPVAPRTNSTSRWLSRPCHRGPGLCLIGSAYPLRAAFVRARRKSLLPQQAFGLMI